MKLIEQLDDRARNFAAKRYRKQLKKLVKEFGMHPATTEVNSPFDKFMEELNQVETSLQDVLDYQIFLKLERLGVEVPADKYEVSEATKLLGEQMDLWEEVETKRFTKNGRLWAKRQLADAFKREVEFWAKLVLPILSLAVAGISFFLSLSKH